MQLDHERLDVYDLALEFLVLANGVIEGLPRGRSHLADQFARASLSLVLNLAEGAGKHSKLDKRRYYVTARGSATESAALLDVCQRLKLLDEAGHRAGKSMLVRIVSMLIKVGAELRRIGSDAQPKQRTAESNHCRVVTEGLFITSSKAPCLLEQVERALDLLTGLVQLLVVRQLTGSAAVGWDDRQAALAVQCCAKCV
jgi:four helix bundle protein